MEAVDLWVHGSSEHSHSRWEEKRILEHTTWTLRSNNSHWVFSQAKHGITKHQQSHKKLCPLWKNENKMKNTILLMLVGKHCSWQHFSMSASDWEGRSTDLILTSSSKGFQSTKVLYAMKCLITKSKKGSGYRKYPFTTEIKYHRNKIPDLCEYQLSKMNYLWQQQVKSKNSQENIDSKSLSSS